VIHILFPRSFIYTPVKAKIAISLAALFAIATCGFGQTLSGPNLEMGSERLIKKVPTNFAAPSD
jgi:hypothetical protein